MANQKLDGALEDLEVAHRNARGFLEVILDSSARQLASIPCCEATTSKSMLPEDGLHGWLSVTEILSRALASVGIAAEYLADVREEYSRTVREKLGCAHIRIPDAQGKTATPSLSEGSHGHDDRNTRHGGAPRFSATEGQNPSATEFCRTARQKPLVPTAEEFEAFERRDELKRSLIARGEILTEESFLLEALGATEAILEMAPRVHQSADGGPSLEDEAARAFSALRAALRCGARSIESVDIDASDLGEAAQ